MKFELTSTKFLLDSFDQEEIELLKGYGFVFGDPDDMMANVEENPIIEINTLEELLAIGEKTGRDLVVGKYPNMECYFIEIYNDRRE